MAITRITSPAITSVSSTSISGTIPQGNIANASLGAVTDLPAAVKGMDRLATTAISSDVSSVVFDVNHNNDSTFNNYSHYIIYMANLLGDGSAGDWQFRIGVSSASDIKTSGYMRNIYGYKPDNGSALQDAGSTSSDNIIMALNSDLDSASRPMFGEVHFYKKGNVGSSYKPAAYGEFYSENTGGYFQRWHFHGSYETAVDTNYIQISTSTGNI